MAKRKAQIMADRKVKRSKKGAVARSASYRTMTYNRGDVHYVDVAETSLVISTTTGVQLLNGTLLGDDVFNRHGRQIRLQAVKLRYALELFQDATAPAVDYLRYVIVYDRQSNAAAPAWADVFTTTTAAGTATQSSYSEKNESNRDRFVVLVDRHLSVPEPGSAGGGSTSLGQMSYSRGPPQEDVIYKKLGGLEVRYNTGTAGTIADITTGGLFLMTRGSNAAAASQWRLNYQSRVYFSP